MCQTAMLINIDPQYKLIFGKDPLNLSTQNLLCIEYDHLDLSRHDLGKALLFCPFKIYSALYVHPDFRTNFNISTCTCT